MINKIKQFFAEHKKLTIIIAVILVIVFFMSRSKGKKEESTTEYTVSKGTVESLINATGKLSGNNVRKLSFYPAGIVDKIFVETGSAVKKGDPIASLDKTLLQAQLKIAQGNLASSNANLAKAKDNSQVLIQENLTKIAQIDTEVADHENTRTIQIADNNDKLSSYQLDVAEINQDYADGKESAQTLKVSQAAEDVQGAIGPLNQTLAEEQTKLTQIQLDKNLEIQDVLLNQAKLNLQNAQMSSDSQVERSKTTLEKLQAQAANASIQLNQAKNMYKLDVDALNGQYSSAQGSVDIAQYNLNHSTIYAPFDGTVLDVPFKEGDQYMGQASGTVLFADLSKYKIEVNVNELDIENIQEGQKAIVEIDGISGKTFEGKVTKIHPGPQGADNLVTFQVDVEFSNADSKLYLGMTANVDFVTQQKDNVLHVPIIAVNTVGDKNYVKVKNGTQIVDREVTLGLQGETDVEIVSGLNEGEIIVY